MAVDNSSRELVIAATGQELPKLLQSLHGQQEQLTWQEREAN